MRTKSVVKHFTLLPILVLILASGLFPRHTAAQVDNGVNIGFPPNGIFIGDSFDTVQTANGYLHVHVPLYSAKGRNGTNVSVSLEYDNPAFNSTITTGNKGAQYQVWHLATTPPWRLVVSTDYGVKSTIWYTVLCGSTTQIPIYTNTTLSEPDGTTHHFIPDEYGAACFTPIANGLQYADDGSGWMLRVDPNSGNPGFNNGNDAIRSDGTEFTFTTSGQTLTDSNGNQINSASPYHSIVDTLGRSVTFPACTSGFTQCSVGYTDSNGAPQSIQYTQLADGFGTTFACNPGVITCTQYNGPWYLPTQIVLPNGLQYSFSYTTSTDGFPVLTGATLPTGGSVSWVAPVAIINGEYYAPQITSRTVHANGNNYTWNYAYGFPYGGYTTTITDPANNDTVYTSKYVGTTTSSLRTTEIDYYTGTGGTRAPLKTDVTAYSTTIPNLFQPISTTTTWSQTSQVSQVQTDWDSFNTGQVTVSWNNVMNRREYGFGTGAPGSLVRTTSFNYLHLTNSAYRLANIANRPTSNIVYEANGMTIHSQSTYTYDSTTLGTPTSGVVGHDYANHGSSNTVRGNTTLVKNWRNSDNTWPTTTNYYNDLGNLLQTQDPRNNSTYFSYTDSWNQSTCAPATGTAQAFITTTTNALGQFTKAKYDSCSSMVGSTTDPNILLTSYQYDLMGRITQTTLPNGGLIATTYGTTLPINVVTTQKINSGETKKTASVLDDRGQVKQTQLFDPQGTDFTDYTHDAFGRILTVSNPYRGSPTNLFTTYSYDPLGRTLTVTEPDSSIQSTQYCGSATLNTDEASHWRRMISDGLGRMTEVDEPSSTSSTSGACAGSGGPVYTTTYGYDVANNLTSVLQAGSRARTFVYDSLSELTSATNPETGSGGTFGTIYYTYDANGNVSTIADPRPANATYTYEALNRVKTKSFTPDSKLAATYTYDATACSVVTQCANVGHLTSMTDQDGSETISYDTVDSMASDSRTIGTVTKTTTYTYNLDGSLAKLVYPSGRVVNYTVDSAGRPSLAQDNSTSAYYYQGTCPNGIASNGACYTPQGSLSQMINGTNLATTYIYNTRLQPCWIYATTSTALATSHLCVDSATAGTILDLKPSFSLGSDNGNVSGITNNRDTTRSQSFAYDQLNRLILGETASTFATSPSHCWGETFTYDAWGNFTNIGVASTAYNGCTQESLNVTATVNNQLSATGYSYDAAGHMLNDGHNAFTWYSEGSLASGAGQGYMYDGSGNRTEKTTLKFYWYGTGSAPLDESNTSGIVSDEYVYLGGQRIAHISEPSGTVYYYAEDHLGTSREMVQAGQTAPCYDADFYPFGKQRAYTTTCDQNYKFTTKERDVESNLDNFGARYDSSTIGRFMSPDAIGPGQHPENPQTWNLYSYVTNNPLTLVDPTGEYVCDLSTDTHTGTMTQKECDNFQKALDRAQVAANNLMQNDPDGSKYQNAERAISAYGKEGVDNGVTIKQGDTGIYDAETDVGHSLLPITHDNPNGQNITVTFNADRNLLGDGANIDAAAGLDSHEGVHVADASDWVSSGFSGNANPSVFQTERDAFRVQASIAEGLGWNSLRSTHGPVGFSFSLPLDANAGASIWLMIKSNYPKINNDTFSRDTKVNGPN